MTPEDLEAAVLAGDVTGVLELIAGSSEDERLACGARMVKLRKAHGEWRHAPADQRLNEASLLALFGTGSAAQIEAGRRMWNHEAAFTVLRRRPETVLVALVPWMLDRLGWPFVRALVREGTIPRPSSDAYIVGMLDGFADADQLLRDDPDLLDHEVWQLFEVEGTGDHSLADHDKYSTDARTWSHALLARSPRYLDRDRLLDASLAALERDFPAFRAGWFSRFHEALEPSPAERAARVDAYLRLLRSPIPATVSFAVASLSQVQRARSLDGARLVTHVEPVMTARATGTAREGLRLVERAVDAEPSLRQAASIPVAAALAHGSADVQVAAVTLLESWSPLDRDVMAALAARRADVAASVRPRLDAILGPAGETTASPSPVVTPLAAPLAAPAGDPFDALVPLEPVSSLPALVELLVGILEREGPPGDLERALDGVLRFPRDGSPEFRRLTTAIRVRADKLATTRNRPPGIAVWFATLIGAWVDGMSPIDASPARPTIADYLARRVHEVARIAATGRRSALLALPSYEGGWIDRAAFEARLAARPRDEIPALDLTQARLRVHPAPPQEREARFRIVVGKPRWYTEPELVVDPAAASEPDVDDPTDLLWRVAAHNAGFKDHALVDWASLIWPQDRRSWFAVSAALLLGNLDWWEARWLDRQRLEPLFEPWTPLGREAGMLLAVALQAREPGQRGLAVDAAIAGIETGRLPAATVVEGFDEVAAGLADQPQTAHPITLFRPGRLATSLGEIARRGDGHRAWAFEVSAGALARTVRTTLPEPVPVGQNTPLLRLLVELSAACGATVPADARPALEVLAKGSGEAARLSRTLLAAPAAS